MILDRGMRIQGFLLKGIWIDVGRPRDLIRANLVTARNYGSGTGTLRNTDVDGTAYVGKGSEITDSNMKDGVILSGSFVMHSSLNNALIMEDCKICGAHIQDSIIGEGCVINEGAIIRNSVLEDGSCVGPGVIIDERREI